ncbi:Hypothetical protein I595_960 [Croceitalea dokdonensis DOKDO 023]|uniref:Uncharacterized protein n=1 Tax=Croceitalea dokdonensis DOKDO 023 TaxID=1300341 RepID=A0A0P7B0S8_9FLAO|nr:Hypothetical protein I595_960 [Croceitalea dokdonensis DOKDO 023]
MGINCFKKVRKGPFFRFIPDHALDFHDEGVKPNKIKIFAIEA